MDLHSENMDLCRICLKEPESDRSMRFVDIFPSTGPDEGLCRTITELLGFKVERYDSKPKIICDCCYQLLSKWSEMKHRAKESQIIIDFVVAKKNLPDPMKSTPDLPLDCTVDNRPSSTVAVDNLPSSTVTVDNQLSSTVAVDNRPSTTAIIADVTVRETPLEDSSQVHVISDSEESVLVISDSEESVDGKPVSQDCEKPTERACQAAVVPAEVAADVCALADTRRNTKSTRSYAHRVHISSMTLFTCMKPYCNVISSSFVSFKTHCRQHLGIKHRFTCWKCMSDYSTLSELRSHQSRDDCQRPGMFQCFECNTFYDNVQILSVHKLTAHDCIVMAKNTLRCPFCKLERNSNTFGSHLIECRNERNNFVVYGSPKKPDPYAMATTGVVEAQPKSALCRVPSFKCTQCRMLCKTRGGLTNHLKKHLRETAKKRLSAKQTTYKIIDRSPDGKLTIATNYRSTDDVDDSHDRPVSENIGAPFSLAERWPGCSAGVGVPWTESSKKPLLSNYYCGHCNEYFTHVGFGQHWRTVHGEQLRAKRYRRFRCDQCRAGFVYKIALKMHREHEHDLRSTVIMSEAGTPVQCLDASTVIDDALMEPLPPVVVAASPVGTAEDGDGSCRNPTNRAFGCDQRQSGASDTTVDGDHRDVARSEIIREVFGCYPNDDGSGNAEWNGIAGSNEDDEATEFEDPELWKSNEPQNQSGKSNVQVALDELDTYVTKIANEMIIDNYDTTPAILSASISDDLQLNTNANG